MAQFCYLKRPMLQIPNHGLLAVSSKRSYWMNGEKLEIYLYPNAIAKKQEIGEVFEHWLKNTSLSFQFIATPENSDIRIEYVPNQGSWSYIGTDALLIDKSEATMGLGWPGKEVIYHEVGHALALLHEHQNPLTEILWDKAAVIKDLSGPPNNWSVEMIHRNVFDTINPDSVNYTSFDGKSVMLYFFPPHWTLNGVGSAINLAPSAVDFEHIAMLYPKPKPVIDVDPRVLAGDFPNLNRLLRSQLVYMANAFGERDFSKAYKKELIEYIKNLKVSN